MQNRKQSMSDEPAKILFDDFLRHESSFRRLAHQMLAKFPVVRRWEETDDIVQEAAMRLHRALESVSPESQTHAQRIAAVQIRRQLIDLARRYSSGGSMAANHDTAEGQTDAWASCDGDQPSLQEWAEFHQTVEQLPEPIREAFELLWYGELSQEEAAKVLDITTRQVQRRWRTAKILLGRQLDLGDLLSGD